MGLQTPTPRDIVLVGVTGHRFLSETDKLTAAVEQALDRIIAAFPLRPLRAISPLAEGADRLVARAVLRRVGSSLLVPLPLEVDDYRRDFANEDSRLEFDELLAQAAETIQLPPDASRNEAYEQVGVYVADHSDALIALWDGQGVQGEGGTADVVQAALDRGIPVFHILAGNRKPGTREPTSGSSVKYCYI